ncbi:GNAT family N-acetyltransferase [Cohnella terricola]|uniref:GNAT family N-acetyltransferase n=1 Tax=Cohnella terricola TaxID=1289167 RepID=A0A559J674_9BACL|nr:GNAT family N-acetyltransferase [Cohnella terricola]TVX95326.1 GNAT family N-acetyltransferase [Cohnella terricola]
MNLSIRLLDENDDIPYDLLLLADPSKKLVDEYLQRGYCYVAHRNGELVGEFVLIRTHPCTVEIVNITVNELYQGIGIGRSLVLRAIDEAKVLGAKTIEIGTANSSFKQLKLYQSCGFRMVGVDIGFFERHYEEELYEDGLRAIDMVRLRIEM